MAIHALEPHSSLYPAAQNHSREILGHRSLPKLLWEPKREKVGIHLHWPLDNSWSPQAFSIPLHIYTSETWESCKRGRTEGRSQRQAAFVLVHGKLDTTPFMD